MQSPYRKPGKYIQMNTDPLITKEKFEELKNKLEKLKQIRPKLAAEVSALAANGDFSENVEYQIAKGKLRGVNNGILNLESQVYQAQIIDPKDADTVALGHKVTIETNGEQKTYQILGSTETNPQSGVISHHSPIGSALIDHSVGEEVTIKLANKEVKYKIIEIE